MEAGVSPEVAQNYTAVIQCETLAVIKDGTCATSCLQCRAKFAAAQQGFSEMQIVTRLRI